MSSFPSFPPAQTAQIIRASQRDLLHVSSLYEQFENVFRTWLGTRWLSKWSKELDLLVKTLYYGLTVGHATQTLGQEYTDTWYHSTRSRTTPTIPTRAALVLIPSLSSYMVSRCQRSDNTISRLARVVETVSELNLAVFYLRGNYYDLLHRFLGVKHISAIPDNPHTRPPSYALLGIMILIRLVHRAITTLRQVTAEAAPQQDALQEKMNVKHAFIDGVAVVAATTAPEEEDLEAKPAEEDERTMLNIPAVPSSDRAGRNCTLCLEERTDSCATECGHMFCWPCISGWGREKVRTVLFSSPKRNTDFTRSPSVRFVDSRSA
ncbi:Pex12 amino terminal region-domain-containing protein [Pterulicium gracile]|uniref:RING-type E3 ubiquitin transferase n=1 Tax=Pterulicium gracile TaxID=1884261 RepID=A0A5C3QY92_9AGAR|nr:Pex12 amino terminal region-domain-containing protein [Pterula gracilis]